MGNRKSNIRNIKKLYGSDFVSKTYWHQSKRSKPKEFDINAPTKNIYSPDAFKDPKLLDMS